MAGLGAGLVVVTLVGSTGWIAARPHHPGDLEAFHQAETPFDHGRFREALDGARAAVAVDRASIEGWLGLGRIAELLGEFDEARRAYDRAQVLAPGLALVTYRRAAMAARVGEYERALALAEQIVAGHPWWIRWLLDHAPGRFQVGLLEANPVLGLVVDLRIDVLLEQGEVEDARSLAWRHGIVHPGRDYCDDASDLRSREAATAGELVAAYRRAWLGNPDRVECVAWFGRWVTDRGHVRLGQRLMIEAAAKRPSARAFLQARLGAGRPVSKRAEQLALIGRARYARAGDIDGATRLLTEAIGLEPRFAASYLHLGRMAWEEADPWAAIQWFRQAAQADPRSWRAHRELGQALELVGRHDEAEGHLARAVALCDDDVVARLALARVLYARQRYAQYATETAAALRAATASQHELADVRAFLSTYRHVGPGAVLPPVPEVPLLVGWQID